MSILGGSGALAYDFAPQAPGVPPDSINTAILYVGDEETFDDNLFRIPPHSVGVPGATFAHPSQSDTVTVPAVGGEGKWDVAQQDFDLKFQVSDNRFAHNTALDYVGGLADGKWNWHVGPYLTGDVGAVYDRSLAGFSQTRFSGFDLVSSLAEDANARYQFGPHWAAYGGVTGSYNDHSAVIEQFNNFNEKTGKAGVQYVNDGMNTYGFEYQYVDLNFKQSTAEQVYDYREDSVRFLLHYGLSDKTFIDGYGGYLRRQYPGLAIGAYSGEIGRIAATYNWTEKTQFVLSGWHELHAYLDAESDYFVAQGVSLSPVWNATEKLSFVLLASIEKQDYIASNSVSSSTPRHDKIGIEQATVRYTPRRALIFDLFIRHEQRTSNQFIYSYNDNLVSGSVIFKFM